MLNHENILRNFSVYLSYMDNFLEFKAVDISSSVDSITQMMLVTDFHEHGSLYDYLRKREPLEIREALNLAYRLLK